MSNEHTKSFVESKIVIILGSNTYKVQDITISTYTCFGKALMRVAHGTGQLLPP